NGFTLLHVRALWQISNAVIHVFLCLAFSMHPMSRSSSLCQMYFLILTDQGLQIRVYGADYGRRDTTTCIYKRPDAQVQNVLCSAPSPKVAERCNGKNNCTISATNSVFGDPCGGTYKYLEVAYICQCK
uniref:SUEL-type lectin domain-containing protein n=1 Tax=Gasterosteus aculeatus aculeatus TaxID=481459 RepID=A0AAQ4NZP9_GASAC